MATDHYFLKPAIETAVIEAKGPVIRNLDTGEAIIPPTTAELQAMITEMVRDIIGQKTLPPSGSWRMSNNSLSKRVDAAQESLNTVDSRIQTAVEAILQAVDIRLTGLQHAVDAGLQAQADALTASLAQARTDLHAEILGSAGPLLDTINQLKALVSADDAADTAIHTQLFALLGEQSTKLTQALSSITALQGQQTSTGNAVQSLQTSVSTNAADIAGLKSTDTGLRTDLTTQTGRIDAVTATANAAQSQSTANTTEITGLKQVDTGLRTDVNAAKSDITALKAIPTVSFRNGTDTTNSALKLWKGSGTSDSTGKVTFTPPTGYFTAVANALPSVVRAVTGPTQYGFAEVVSMSASQIVVQLAESKSTGVLVLNTMVEGLEASPAGITVNITVYGI